MAEQTASLTPAERHHFLVRRLHSLTGLVPVGLFVCVHLVTNASILAASDGSEFQKAVERIHSLGPLLVPVEIVFIFLPLAFHALLGVKIWLSSTPNPMQYRYSSNVRYTLQRTTGIITFGFVIYHIWQMHWLGKSFGGGAFELHDASGAATGAMTTAMALRSWWVAPIYALGVVSAVFHLANGIWTSLITWGITIKPQSQRAAGYVCATFGIVLCVVGLGALRGFKTFETGPVGAAQHSAATTTHVP